MAQAYPIITVMSNTQIRKFNIHRTENRITGTNSTNTVWFVHVYMKIAD